MKAEKLCICLTFVLITAFLFTTCADAASIRSAGAVANLPDIDGAKLAREVIEKLGEQPKAWVFFAYDKPKDKKNPTPEGFLQNIIDGICSVDKDIPLMGCWTKTGMFAFGKGESIIGDALLVGLTGEGVSFKAGLSRFKGPGQLLKAAHELAEQLKPENGKGLMIFITDSRPAHDGSYPVAKMYPAMQEILGPNVGLVGGNTAYMSKPVFFNDTITSMAMVGLMISGNMEFKIVVEPGKEAISPPLMITKLAKPHEIVELNDRPWMDVYKEHLTGYVDPNTFDAKIKKGGGAFGTICRDYPYAIVKEHNQLYVRLVHGLSPWGKGTNLPSECYNFKVGDKIVVTKKSKDQLGCLRKGMKRLKANMPSGRQLFLLFPCESNSAVINGSSRSKFFDMVQGELPKGATGFGFFPCGEHASWYEPDKDKQVCEGRYHQLSYPMAVVVAKPEQK